MQPCSRREFMKVAATSVLLGAEVRAARRGSVSGPSVPLGIATDSLRDLPRDAGTDRVDVVIDALKRLGVTLIELSSSDIEPASETGGDRSLARTSLRTWRTASTSTTYAPIRAKFDAAGVQVYSLVVPFGPDVADDEIYVMFQQGAALGARTLCANTTLDTARRIAPFAARHRQSVAFQNQLDATGDGAVATPLQFDALVALSPWFRLDLDVGTLTSAVYDAATELRRALPKVSHVRITDKLMYGGASQPFGQGDTPIDDVLAVLLAQQQEVIPAFVEYDYAGKESSIDELQQSLTYVRQLLAARTSN
jgi:hypothetical protein